MFSIGDRVHINSEAISVIQEHLELLIPTDIVGTITDVDDEEDPSEWRVSFNIDDVPSLRNHENLDFYLDNDDSFSFWLDESELLLLPEGPLVFHEKTSGFKQFQKKVVDA